MKEKQLQFTFNQKHLEPIQEKVQEKSSDNTNSQEYLSSYLNSNSKTNLFSFVSPRNSGHQGSNFEKQEKKYLRQIDELQYHLKAQQDQNRENRREMSHQKGIINIQNQHIKKLTKREQEYFSKFENVNSDMTMLSNQPSVERLNRRQRFSKNHQSYDFSGARNRQIPDRFDSFSGYNKEITTSMSAIPNSSRQWGLFSPPNANNQTSSLNVKIDMENEDLVNIVGNQPRSTRGLNMHKQEKREIQTNNFCKNRNEVRQHIITEKQNQQEMNKNLKAMFVAKNKDTLRHMHFNSAKRMKKNVHYCL